MGKKCCVPHCHTGYRNYNEKYPLYGAPKDDNLLNIWQEVIARADRNITPNDAVCQRHFRDDDFLFCREFKGRMEQYKVPKLKPDAVPSIFPVPPDSIHGTVKKRRKLSVDQEQYRLNVNFNESKNFEENSVGNVDIKVENGDENYDQFVHAKNVDTKDDSGGVKDRQMSVLCKEIEPISEAGKVNKNKEQTPYLEDKQIKEEKLNEENTDVLHTECIFKEEITIKEDFCEEFDKKEQGTQEGVDKKYVDTLCSDGTREEKMFECTHCSYQSKWSYNVQIHQSKHLEGEKNYFKCIKCPNFGTNWINTYRNHVKNHVTRNKKVVDGKRHKIRGKVKAGLIKHSKNHENGNNYECKVPDCSYYTKSKALYELHTKNHHGNDIDQVLDLSVKKTYFDACENSTKKVGKNTSKINNTQSSFGNNNEPYIAKQNFSEFYRFKIDNPSFLNCFYCHFTTDSKEVLSEHYQEHFLANGSKESQYKCENCQFKTDLKHEFLKHTLAHRGISIIENGDSTK